MSNALQELHEALTSGKYTQIQDEYIDPVRPNHCCAIGSLILDRRAKGDDSSTPVLAAKIDRELGAIDAGLSAAIVKKNDGGDTFDELATWIKEAYPQYFTD